MFALPSISSTISKHHLKSRHCRYPSRPMSHGTSLPRHVRSESLLMLATHHSERTHGSASLFSKAKTPAYRSAQKRNDRCSYTDSLRGLSWPYSLQSPASLRELSARLHARKALYVVSPGAQNNAARHRACSDPRYQAWQWWTGALTCQMWTNPGAPRKHRKKRNV